jgi:pseudo-rSAM protein
VSNNCNLNNNEKVCLYIEPYVHVNIKNDDCLLYNTLDGQLLVYENNPAIAALLGRMMLPQNLNAIVEEKPALEEENIQEFLETTGKMQLLSMYNYSKKDNSHKKPVSIPQILNFHRERKRMAMDPERDPGQEIIKYLHKLDIYINCCHGVPYDTPLFTQGYKQFLFPYSSKEYRELELAHIRRLLEQVKALGLCSITVLGGNIFQYKELDGLMNLLAQLPLKKELGVFYKDIAMDNLERIDREKLKDIPFKIFVEPQPDRNQLVRCIELSKKFDILSTYQFTIQSEADADNLDEFIDMVGQNRFSVKPFYNGSNFDFFRENIFIQKEDLSDPVVSKKDIYARSVMNTADFGHITVLSSGDVYSNVNEEPLGMIDQVMKELLLKELSQGKGWFRLRSELTPCADCIYRKICTPVSNYEYAFSRNDLCWLHRDTGEK